MLHELEDEVHFTNEEPDFQWDDDEDSHNEKKLEDKKSGNAVLTSAQAKLAKELINWPTHTRCQSLPSMIKHAPVGLPIKPGSISYGQFWQCSWKHPN
jgi:hypothetical protein